MHGIRRFDCTEREANRDFAPEGHLEEGRCRGSAGSPDSSRRSVLKIQGDAEQYNRIIVEMLCLCRHACPKSLSGQVRRFAANRREQGLGAESPEYLKNCPGN
jgi:hypothetical protein